MGLPNIQIGDGMLGSALLGAVDVTQELNQHWWCTITCRQTEDQRVPVEDMLGKALKITTIDEDGGTHTHFAGFVYNVRLVYEVWGSYTAYLTGVSKSYLLDVTARKQYYGDQTLSAIAGTVGGRDGVGVAVNASASKALNYVQYGETDFAFLNRIVDDYGAWLRPSESGLEVFDSFQSGTSVQWRDTTTGLIEFSISGTVAPPSFTGSHYDHHAMASNTFQNVAKPPQFFPAASRLTGAVQNASQLLPAGFEPQRARAMTLGDYNTQLQAEAERSLGGAVTATGQSRNQTLMAGNTLNVQGVLDAQGTYGLIRVVHQWTTQGYTNDFVCTPWKNYRNPKPPALRSWNGVVPARVVDHHDPKKMGRIKVQFFWQTDGSTHWARATSPHAGPDRGFMFMPEVGDEVAVAFEDGDPERPVILGSVWNGVQQAPRVGFFGADADIPDNNVKRVVTKSGNRMQMVDTPTKETVVLASPNKTQMTLTEMHDATGRPLVHVHSDGDIIFTAPNGRVHFQSQTFSREVGSGGPKAEAAAALPAAAASSAAPAAPAHAGGIGGFMSGLFDSTLRPLGHMIAHPIDTVEGIAHAVAHPIDTIGNVAHAVKETGGAALHGDTYAMGTALGTVGMFAVPGAGEAEAAEDAARLGQIGELGEAADAGNAAKLGEASDLSKATDLGDVSGAADQLNLPTASEDASSVGKSLPLKPALTGSSDQAAIDAFKSSVDPQELSRASTFETKGLNVAEAKDYLASDEGQEYMDQLHAADPTASSDELSARALEQFQTGYAPTLSSSSEPLYKLVPKGTNPSEYSPFFTKQVDLHAAISSGKPLGDAFGLPLASQSAEYDVFQITPNAGSQPILESTVAPTEEFGGQYTTSGGAQQSLVPNRAAWSTPTPVGSLTDVGSSIIKYH